MRKSLLIVDDHPLLRDGLRLLLSLQNDFEVVGEAADGGDGLRLASSLQPDVILLDLELPELCGIAMLEAMRRDGLRSRVIVFSTFCRQAEVQRVMQLGARGYVLKDTPREQIFAAIREVAAGRLFFQTRPLALARKHGAEKSLSVREQEVLTLVWAGLLNKEIAEKLGISEGTVKIHLHGAYRKLGAANRSEALREALHRGLLRVD